MKAALFPGQGLAGRDVAAALEDRHSRIDQAEDILGYDLRRVLTQNNVRTLPTTLAQPAILVAGVIAYESAVEAGANFDHALGHSLGEYTALVAAQAISFPAALTVVAARGKAMQKAASSSTGGMAAILGVPVERARELADSAGVTVANDNSPRQVVVAGDDDGLSRIASFVRDEGARCVRLSVEGPFHTDAMAPAMDVLADALVHTDVRSPRFPVISNVTALPYRSPGEVRKLLVQQLTTTVRFRESIAYLVERGVDDFVDLGPGQVVGSLARACIAEPREAVHA